MGFDVLSQKMREGAKAAGAPQRGYLPAITPETYFQSPMAKALEQSSRENIARTQQGLSARFNPYGASASRNRASGLAAAQGTRDLNMLQAQNAQTMMQREEDKRFRDWQIANENYYRDQELEEKRRANQWNPFKDILGAGSMFAGSYFGGR